MPGVNEWGVYGRIWSLRPFAAKTWTKNGRFHFFSILHAGNVVTIYQRETSWPAALYKTAGSGSLLFQIGLPKPQLNPPRPESEASAQMRNVCPAAITPPRGHL